MSVMRSLPSTLGPMAGLLTLLVATGCAPGAVEDLGRPAIAVSIRERGGFCSSVYAVDGDGRVWSSGGCGEERTGFAQTGRSVAAAERAELDAAMREVQALTDDPECMLATTGGRRLRFTSTRDGADPETVEQCEPGVPLAALNLAASLEALAASSSVSPDAGD